MFLVFNSIHIEFSHSISDVTFVVVSIQPVHKRLQMELNAQKFDKFPLKIIFSCTESVYSPISCKQWTTHKMLVTCQKFEEL